MCRSAIEFKNIQKQKRQTSSTEGRLSQACGSIGPSWAQKITKEKERKRRQAKGNEKEVTSALRCTQQGWVEEWVSQLALRGVPLLATSPGNYFAPRRPEKLFFSMPISASICYDMLATFVTTPNSKTESQTRQNGFPNRSESKAQTNMGTIRKPWKSENDIRKRGAETSKAMLPCRAKCTFTQIGQLQKDTRTKSYNL